MQENSIWNLSMMNGNELISGLRIMVVKATVVMT